MHWSVRTLFAIMALSGVGVVFAMASSFYTSTATDRVTWWTFLIVSGLSALIKVTFPLALGQLALGRGVRVLAWVLMLGCVLYDTLGVSGFYTLKRGSEIEARVGDGAVWRELRDEVAKLRAMADEMAKTRPTSVIQAEIAAAKVGAPDCTKRHYAPVEACTRLANLQVEAATADERDKRERAWRDARERLEKLPRPNDSAANPLGQGVKPFSDRLGFDPNLVADVLVRALLVLLLEVAPSVCSYLALHGVRRAPKPTEQKAADTAAPPRRRARAGPVDLMGVLRDVQAGRLTAAGLSVSGGGIVVTNRALAKVAATNPTAVNAGLRALQVEGRIRVTPTSAGTRVELV